MSESSDFDDIAFNRLMFDAGKNEHASVIRNECMEMISNTSPIVDISINGIIEEIKDQLRYINNIDKNIQYYEENIAHCGFCGDELDEFDFDHGEGLLFTCDKSECIYRVVGRP